MEDDLFTYEIGVVKDFYFPCIEQPHDNLTNDDLDVYEPRICYDENEQIYVGVTILINKRLVRLIDITVEQWLDLKFGDHKKVDKEIMEEVVSSWLIRSHRKQFEEYTNVKCDQSNVVDDEEVLTEEELFDLEEEKVSEGKTEEELIG
ncbi:hypothetical protein Tco_1037629 [Tanacetum coccineum]